MVSFSEAVDKFEAASPWLGDADLPALVTLRALADELDEGKMVPALIAQYGLTYRALRARSPQADNAPVDPLAAALEAAEK